MKAADQYQKFKKPLKPSSIIKLYFTLEKQFNSPQFRYRTGQGTVKAATSFISYCLEGVDSKGMANTKFFYLSKAFNSVPHSLLINKLRFDRFEDVIQLTEP